MPSLIADKLDQVVNILSLICFTRMDLSRAISHRRPSLNVRCDKKVHFEQTIKMTECLLRIC